jgi:hypothetical protein
LLYLWCNQFIAIKQFFNASLLINEGQKEEIMNYKYRIIAFVESDPNFLPVFVGEVYDSAFVVMDEADRLNRDCPSMMHRVVHDFYVPHKGTGNLGVRVDYGRSPLSILFPDGRRILIGENPMVVAEREGYTISSRSGEDDGLWSTPTKASRVSSRYDYNPRRERDSR